MTPRRALWVSDRRLRAASGWSGPRASGRGTTRRITTSSPSTATGATSTTRRCSRWSSRSGSRWRAGRSRPSACGSGSSLLFAGSTWLMARLASRFYGERAGLLAAFALNVTAYHTAAAGAFALPDGPLLFFWLLTLDRLAAAVASASGSGSGHGPGVGLAWGGALLSKYHAVFLPAGALLYLAVEPSARRWLRRPGAVPGRGDRAAGVLAGDRAGTRRTTGRRSPSRGAARSGRRGSGSIHWLAALVSPGALPVPLDLGRGS